MKFQQKFKHFWRPNWTVSQLKWISFKLPFFSIRIYFKSYMLPYVYILTVFLLAYKFI